MGSVNLYLNSDKFTSYYNRSDLLIPMNGLDRTEDENLDDDPFDEKDDAVIADDDLANEKLAVTYVPVKINKEARKKLEDLQEEKRLKKMIEDDFYDLDAD